MTLRLEQVEQISLLARLQLSPVELETMTSQLSRIVEYVAQLSGLETDQVAHGVERVNVFGEDDPAESLPRDEALANAPKRDDECYRVPAVLGDS